jgi:hypothetical protein
MKRYKPISVITSNHSRSHHPKPYFCPPLPIYHPQPSPPSVQPVEPNSIYRTLHSPEERILEKPKKSPKKHKKMILKKFRVKLEEVIIRVMFRGRMMECWWG